MNRGRNSADASAAHEDAPHAGPECRALRRGRLLATATELFTTRGYPATSVERICGTADLPVRAFYEEFESRESLLIALHNGVARAGMEAALTVLSDPRLEAAEARVRITGMGRAYVEAVTDGAAATRIAFVEVIGAGRAVEEQRLLWRGLWSDFLTAEAERAVARGEAPARDYSLAMVALTGAGNELVAHWTRHSASFSRELLADELIHHALATLGIPAGDGSAAGTRADEGN
ncbi:MULTISPECIES: TetR/AcrR family transcriptional regulator [unclassified Streptomyces]|uniref:TetR/AcrR family transcriptional regulator n=1 Tax=unclassified Streptomyces TaxID=2593676 RepID=UPI002E28FFEC|nr:helix-turn-helix domain-containing protein [Streptomyces sp. NBC_01429]